MNHIPCIHSDFQINATTSSGQWLCCQPVDIMFHQLIFLNPADQFWLLQYISNILEVLFAEEAVPELFRNNKIYGGTVIIKISSNWIVLLELLRFELLG